MLFSTGRAGNAFNKGNVELTRDGTGRFKELHDEYVMQTKWMSLMMAI